MKSMKRSFLVLTMVALGVVFLFAVVYAAQKAADIMPMKSEVYKNKKKRKALVTFTHKKHNVDYKIACAECHHVYKGGKNTWKEGDKVQKCDAKACHDKAKAPKTKKGEKKLKRKEKASQGSHKDAIHENCIECHKAVKKADKTKPVPTKCAQCHPKKKK